MSTSAQVVVLLPQHSSVKPSPVAPIHYDVIILWSTDPRVVWNGLQPLLLQSPKRVARLATKLILSQLITARSISRPSFQENEHLSSSSKYSSLFHQALNEDCQKRVLRVVASVPLMAREARTNPPADRTCRIKAIIWIQPPLFVIQRADRLFGSIVLSWERVYLQLQSLSAFLATLGGGYFLCRQLATAAVLARRQRQLALLLGDYETADKCTINEAYNFIHAGYFKHALRLIQLVQRSFVARNRQNITAAGCGGRNALILSMCESATVFCHRVRAFHRKKQRQRLSTNGKSSSPTFGTISLTKDDYQRIRIDTENAIRQEKQQDI